MIEQVAPAVLASTLYSITFYVKKHQKDAEELFDIRKLVSTMIVGAGIGVGFTVSGTEVIEYASFEEQMAMYAGAVAVVESIIKTIYRYIKSKTA